MEAIGGGIIKKRRHRSKKELKHRKGYIKRPETIVVPDYDDGKFGEKGMPANTAGIIIPEMSRVRRLVPKPLFRIPVTVPQETVVCAQSDTVPAPQD